MEFHRLLLDLESALQDAGFLVVGVPSAEAAVKAFDEGPNKFAGLLTDIRLGSRESGWEVAGHVRRANPTLPVVYISGDGAFSWGSEGVPDSVMIVKPFFPPADHYGAVHTAQSATPNSAPNGGEPSQ